MLGRVSSLDFDFRGEVERDLAMRMMDVAANVGVRVKRFGLGAAEAQYQLFLFVHAELVPRPFNHLAQGRARRERVRLRHSVEDDADLDLFAAADVDAVMFAMFKAAIMSQFFIRVLNTDAPFLGFEFLQMALFAKARDQRTDGFILCKLEAADLFLPTDVDVYFVLHSA